MLQTEIFPNAGLNLKVKFFDPDFFLQSYFSQHSQEFLIKYTVDASVPGIFFLTIILAVNLLH